MNWTIIFTIMLLSTPIVSATITDEQIINDEIKVEDFYCNEEGTFGFRLSPIEVFGQADITGILLRQAGASQFTAVEGEWSRETLVWDEVVGFRSATFKSNQAEAKNAGDHTVKVFYDLDGTSKEIELLFNCPGTKFSCVLFDFNVESCGSYDGKFSATYNVIGIDSHDEYKSMPEYSLGDLTITLVTQDRYCDKDGNCGKSVGIPATATLSKLENEKVQLSWDYETFVKGTSIIFEPGTVCDRRELNFDYQVSDFRNCDPDPFVETFVCEGCELGSICVLEGKKIIQNGESQYCINGKLSPQKPTGSYCAEDIECLTNLCIGNKCADELLPVCEQGLIAEPCKCGEMEIRVTDSKFCCDEEVWEDRCPKSGDGTVDELVCDSGYYKEGNTCVKIAEEKSFWDKVGDFFKGFFKRR